MSHTAHDLSRDFGPLTRDGNLEKNENLMKSRSHRIQVNHMRRIFAVFVLAVMCPLAHAQKLVAIDHLATQQTKAYMKTLVNSPNIILFLVISMPRNMDMAGLVKKIGRT